MYKVDAKGNVIAKKKGTAVISSGYVKEWQEKDIGNQI